MKPYLIIYENGNGYFCNCCRRTHTETETQTFENDEDTISFAKTHNENNKTSDNDSVITAIYALSDINPIY